MFEGWDAAGKGGVIKRLTGEWDPRYFEVWPISAPTARGKGASLPVALLAPLARRSTISRCSIAAGTAGCSSSESRGFATEAEWKPWLYRDQRFRGAADLDGHHDPGQGLPPCDAGGRRTSACATGWIIRGSAGRPALDDYRNRAKRADYLEAMHDMFRRDRYTKAAPWIGDRRQSTRRPAASPR
jgi:hypothetical protein